MGLDSVELLYTAEETLGIEISDLEAEKIATVADFATAFNRKIRKYQSDKCLSQATFYRLRASFTYLFQPAQHIHPKSKIIDLLPDIDLKQEWEELAIQSELKLPKLVLLDFNKDIDAAFKLFGLRLYQRKPAITTQTLKKLIDWTISLNFKKLIDIEKISSKYEVERLICGIISEHMAIPINEIDLAHSITNDLGID